jgi:hypothetical protein
MECTLPFTGNGGSTGVLVVAGFLAVAIGAVLWWLTRKRGIRAGQVVAVGLLVVGVAGVVATNGRAASGQTSSECTTTTVASETTAATTTTTTAGGTTTTTAGGTTTTTAGGTTTTTAATTTTTAATTTTTTGPTNLDLQLTLESAPSPSVPENEITNVVMAINLIIPSQPATDLIAKATLTNGTIATADVQDGGGNAVPYDPATGAIDLASLVSPNNLTLFLGVRVGTPGTFTVSVTVSSAETDRDPSNNTRAVNGTVTP